MHRGLTLIALSIGFAGAVFSFLGVLRIEHMFSDEGVNLGWGKDWSGVFWKSCTPLGIALIGVSFLIEIVALVLYDPHKESHAGGVTAGQQPVARTGEPKGEAQVPLDPTIDG